MNDGNNDLFANRQYLQPSALYRMWRPRTFTDVVEQEHVVTTLMNSIKNNRLAHAYLFCGTRGTGKTTLAQIFSRAVNCLRPIGADPCNECDICTGILAGRILDVAEIDAASNNSVDNIRNLRDLINYKPAQAKYKVYIIDEVHMLSSGAYNALLKTLEEPPSYAIFILATTEPHKLPATIISRCQRFDFRRISNNAIMQRLSVISDAMGVIADIDALRLIAKLSDGALRDAISIYDQCASASNGNPITLGDVLKITGRPSDDIFLKCAQTIAGCDIKSIPPFVGDIAAAGTNLMQFIDGMTAFYRNLLMIKVGHGRELFPELPDDIFKEAMSIAEKCDLDILLAIASEFSTMAYRIKDSSNQLILLEVALSKMCLGHFHSKDAIESLQARIGVLENNLRALARRFDGGAAANPNGQMAQQPPTQQPLTQPTQPQPPTQQPLTQPTQLQPPTTQQPQPSTQPQPTQPTLTPQPTQQQPQPTQQQPQPTQPQPQPPTQPPAFGVGSNSAQWHKIVDKFKDMKNPMIHIILQSSTVNIHGENFRIVLPMNTASLSSFISTPEILAKLRAEIHSATGTHYNVQVISEQDKYANFARQLKDNFDIQANIHP